MIQKTCAIFVLFLFLRCTENSRNVFLNNNDRKKIDSLFKKEILVEKKKSEEMCDSTYANLIQHYIDSLLSKELGEISSLQELIQQND